MRAINADELSEGIRQNFCNVCESYKDECDVCEIAEILRMIDETPTISENKGAETMKLQIMKNLPKWAADTPNLLEHERRQLAQRIGEALYDDGYIEIEEREGYEPGFNCEKSIIIKMTFDFTARNNDTITSGNGAYVKHGHWKQTGNEYKCSICGADAGLNYYREHRMTTKFCPNCGVKMRGDAHEKNTDTV